MANNLPFRSTHIPLRLVDAGWKTVLLPDRAASILFSEEENVKRYVTNYVEHVVTSLDENCAPNISYMFYGTKDLWWFICYFNGIVFPTEEIPIGTKLKIPVASEIETYLQMTSIVQSDKKRTASIVRV